MGLFDWMKRWFKEASPKSPHEARLEWAEKRQKAVEAISYHEKRAEKLLAGVKADPNQKKEYYQERVAHLENKSISAAARLFWLSRLTSAQKQDYVKRFLDLLQDLSTAEDLNVLEQRRLEFDKL